MVALKRESKFRQIWIVVEGGGQSAQRARFELVGLDGWLGVDRNAGLGRMGFSI